MHLRWRNKPTCEGEAPGGPRTLSGHKQPLDIAFRIVNNRASCNLDHQLAGRLWTSDSPSQGMQNALLC